MKNSKTLSAATALVCSFVIAGCNSAGMGQSMLNQAVNTAMPTVPGASGAPASTDMAGGQGSTQAVTYKNNDRNFSFTIPAGWAKQSGDVNSDTVLFMEIPLTKTCSFQFNMTRMQQDFPAKASVKASLDSAKKDIAIDKNISAKRRDQAGVLGWELVEKGQAGGHQRIIYQVYDKQNYYINLMAAAETEHFEECRPALQQIIDSIKFGG